jgi:lysophospholipase L1-like esterase
MKTRRHRMLGCECLEDRTCQSGIVHPAQIHHAASAAQQVRGQAAMQLLELQASYAALASPSPFAQSIPVSELIFTHSGPTLSPVVSPQVLANTPIAKTDPLTLSSLAQYSQQAAAKQQNVVFLGDSIGYQFANGDGAAVWNQQLAPLGAVNYSVIGSTTYNMLYQLESGNELANSPKVAVLQVGTDDLGYQMSVSETVQGIEADIHMISQLSPRTKILLLGVFPSNGATSWIRTDEQQVNAQLAGLANGSTIRFANPGFAYVAPDGSISADTSDTVHPTAAGYGVVANVIVPVLDQMLGIHTAAAAAWAHAASLRARS